MADWKPLVDNPPPAGCKFVALYSDGSGARMFWRHDDGYIDCEGDEREALSDSYSLWTELPKGMTFWCENRSEDCGEGSDARD